MKKHLKLLCIFLIFPAMIWAVDFGVILDQRAGYAGFENDGKADYTGGLFPRFTAHLGDEGVLYVSAGIYMEYEDENWKFVPELLRTDFIWLFDYGDLRIGRMYYTDPLGFIAEGLFDGARFSYNTALGTLSAGAWYTGLLYKKRAGIYMTGDELQSYNAKLDYGDFYNTYFAPRRLVSALEWEHPGLGAVSVIPKLSLLGQFDLTGNSLHSQYLTGKLTFPVNAFLFDLGGSFELIQNSGDQETAFAAELRAAWILPTSFASRLSLSGRYFGGAGANRSAFLPLTVKSQGFILKANPSGISMISLDCLARLHRTFSLGFSSSYFIRNDLQTYSNYPISSGADGAYLLGNEFFGRLFWSPFSDLSAILGCGIFLPSMGNAAPNADNYWRAELNLVLSLY